MVEMGIGAWHGMGFSWFLEGWGVELEMIVPSVAAPSGVHLEYRRSEKETGNRLPVAGS